MDGLIDSLMKTEFVSVWVQDPRMHKEDFWHTHIDYEICLHTNSVCFRKKTSTVRRRYSEFVWLHQRLQENALLMELPKLPPWNPFFSLNNPYHVTQRMQGLQVFLEAILQMPLLLSDSRLHLFLQSQLSMAKMEACALGQTRYSVAQAVQHCSDYQSPQFPVEETGKACCDFPIEETGKACCDFDCERSRSQCRPRYPVMGRPRVVAPSLTVIPLPETESCSAAGQSPPSDQEHI